MSRSIDDGLEALEEALYVTYVTSLNWSPFERLLAPGCPAVFFFQFFFFLKNEFGFGFCFSNYPFAFLFFV